MPLSSPSVPSTAGVQPFQGYVETTADALCIIEAARRGMLPRITRRLNEPERRSMIHSGAVFVFSVEESGIKRWTEGLAWSQSRISGNFLVYREVTDRSAVRGHHAEPLDGQHATHVTEGHGMPKPNGLVKKTITVKIENSDHHLISYFTQEDVETGRLQRPTSRPDLMAIEIPAELLQSSNFRYPLKLEPRYGSGMTNIDGADEIDNRSETSVSPVSTFSRTSARFAGRQAEEPAGHPAGGSMQFSRSLNESTDTSHTGHARQYGTAYPSVSSRMDPAFARSMSPVSPVQGQYGANMSSSPLHAMSASWPPPEHASPQSFSSASAAYHTPPSTAYVPGQDAWGSVPSAPVPRAPRDAIHPQGAGVGHADPSSWPPYGVAPPFAAVSPGASTPAMAVARREHARARSYPAVYSAWGQDASAEQYQYQYAQDPASGAGPSDAGVGGQSARDTTYSQPR